MGRNVLASMIGVAANPKPCSEREASRPEERASETSITAITRPKPKLSPRCKRTRGRRYWHFPGSPRRAVFGAHPFDLRASSLDLCSRRRSSLATLVQFTGTPLHFTGWRLALWSAARSYSTSMKLL